MIRTIGTVVSLLWSAGALAASFPCEKAQTKTLRLYPEDLARLQRLMVRMRLSEGAVVREALELLERREP